MSERRRKLSVDEAVLMIPDGELIHTFRNSRVGILGEEYTRKEILEIIANCECELSGDIASNLGHKIVAHDKYRCLFIETRKDIE